MSSYICLISGISPLLQHRFSETEEVQRNSRKVHIKAEDPREVAEKSAYRNDDGHLYIPGAAVARMLREAGGAHKQRGSRKSLKYIIPASVLVLDEIILLRDSDGGPLTDFEVDSRPVVIPATKGRIMRHRPRLNSWAAEFSLEIDEDSLDSTTVYQLLTEAGSKIGLGDYRPEKGGPFGRFQAVRWSLLEEKMAA